MLCRWVFVGTSLLYFQFADAQDVMKVAANHYKVLVENAHVRVVENTLNPGDEDSTHTHPAGWYYVTKPGTMKIDFADGKTETWVAKAREAGWMGAEGPHTSENVERHKWVTFWLKLKALQQIPKTDEH